MKKTVRLCAVCLLLLLGAAGCGEDDNANESLTLTAQQQQQHQETIATVLDENYWEYDTASITFLQSTLPTKEDAPDFYTASADCGYRADSYSGKEATLATASLIHYNGDAAGTALFYFCDGTLRAVCYQGGYDNGYYSLKERNPFLADGHFSQYEDWEGISSAYTETTLNLPQEGPLCLQHLSDGTCYALFSENGTISLWKENTSSFYKVGTFYLNGAFGVDAACLEQADGTVIFAVLVTFQNENETTIAEIRFFDENLSPLTEETFAAEEASAVTAMEQKLLVYQGQKLNIYEKNAEGVWAVSTSFQLRHYAQAICTADLDGNGTMEYLISDGMDLYLYQQNGQMLRRIWSTHLGIDTLYGHIFCGDMNGDGVQEIYVSDMTGTSIRYILTEHGLRSSNEDILYGERIYPDIQADGSKDYLKITEYQTPNATFYHQTAAGEDQ